MRDIHLGIIGTGGFAREVLQLAMDIHKKNSDFFCEINFIELDEYFEQEFVDNIRVLKLSNCDLAKMKFVIAVANPMIKNRILKQLPKKLKFTSIISQLAFIANDFKPKKGLIVMPFSYVSCNVKIGKHVHINSHCTIGHDTIIGDFSTTACSVMISGNNDIGNYCYFGMNSSTRQGLSICDNVTIGLNAGVVKDITTAGTYIGTPSKILF
tara:strand:- start:37 stop:669 length:633 start_codon:yes stop_codon:yes gene_type:complete